VSVSIEKNHKMNYEETSGNMPKLTKLCIDISKKVDLLGSCLVEFNIRSQCGDPAHAWS